MLEDLFKRKKMMNFRTFTPGRRMVKECVDDMLSSLESCLDLVNDVENRVFSQKNLEVNYQIFAKQRELLPTGCSRPPSEIVCGYCGDNSDHVMQVRGGGGLDEMCVTQDTDIQTGRVRVFFSCRSCLQNDKEYWTTIHNHQREDICIGCGIHTTLKGDEGAETLNPVCLCFQDSEGISSTDYYFCTTCLQGSLDADVDGDTTPLEKLVIDRIQKFQSFIGDEYYEIKIPEGYDLPDPPSTDADSPRNLRRVLFSDSEDDLEMTSDEELFDTYEGEYENEELPENNGEKASEIKGAIKEVGEKMFDLQEQIKEGDYLEIMNLLQKVTNKVNSL